MPNQIAVCDPPKRSCFDIAKAKAQPIAVRTGACASDRPTSRTSILYLPPRLEFVSAKPPDERGDRRHDDRDDEPVDVRRPAPLSLERAELLRTHARRADVRGRVGTGQLGQVGGEIGRARVSSVARAGARSAPLGGELGE